MLNHIWLKTCNGIHFPTNSELITHRVATDNGDNAEEEHLIKFKGMSEKIFCLQTVAECGNKNTKLQPQRAIKRVAFQTLHPTFPPKRKQSGWRQENKNILQQKITDVLLQLQLSSVWVPFTRE